MLNNDSAAPIARYERYRSSSETTQNGTYALAIRDGGDEKRPPGADGFPRRKRHHTATRMRHAPSSNRTGIP